MSTKQHYDEDFKRTLVELYHNGKTQASLIKEYGVSQTALSRWVKQYSTVETDDGEVLTAKQVKELQKRMAQPSAHPVPHRILHHRFYRDVLQLRIPM